MKKTTRNLDNILTNFYDNRKEDERLHKDNMHKLELITTLTYIDKYLQEGDKILEVGAGTGAYSLHYADKGYEVDALELVESNLNILQNHVKPNMKISPVQWNALDLSQYQDNSFDITLVLGPLYHLFKEEEVDTAIKEAIRVTKKGGILYIAFTLFDLTMLRRGFIDGNLCTNIGPGEMVNDNYQPVNNEKLIFNMMYMSEINALMDKYPLEKLHAVATDGVGRTFQEQLNNFDDETYQHFVNYHLSICEREDLIGYSGHVLYIAKKK